MSLTGMRQRCWVHDYCAPSFYMLTIVTEPRRGCLSEVGELGRHAAGPGELLTLSAMGDVVQAVWGRTSTVFPGVEACECVAMPDHFHGILWVKERQERHVGHIVKAFKRVSEIECRSKGLLLPPNPSKGLLLPPNPSKGLRLPPNLSKGLRLPPNPSKGLRLPPNLGKGLRMLAPYGCDWVQTPHFRHLAERDGDVRERLCRQHALHASWGR